MSLIIIKILITLFMVIWIPNYWKNYGLQNFLWLSDVGVFLTFFAVWFNSPLLISMAMIGILPAEIAWNIDFFVELFTGRNLLGIAHYMFDGRKSKFLRGISLFHVALPIIWIGYLLVWKYDSQALYYQVILTWMVFMLTYLFSDPQKNINWIFMPQVHHWKMPGLIWLGIMLVAYPLLIILPIHLLLLKL